MVDLSVVMSMFSRPGNFKVAFLGSLLIDPAEIQDIAVALQCVDPQQARYRWLELRIGGIPSGND